MVFEAGTIIIFLFVDDFFWFVISEVEVVFAEVGFVVAVLIVVGFVTADLFAEDLIAAVFRLIKKNSFI